MMNAAVLEGPNRIAVREVETPSCGPKEAILKVMACAVCGSDIRIYHYGNDRVHYPAVTGHEIAGEVVEAVPPEAGERPEVRLTPLVGLFARYREITPPAGLPPSVLLGWRMAGQRLIVLTQGAGDEAELYQAGRLAGYLSREAPTEMARWAVNLLNALHSQP